MSPVGELKFAALVMALAIAAAACSAPPAPPAPPAATAPPVPFEDSGACPFEGCTYREWGVDQPVAVRADRRADAPVAFQLQAGAKVTALTGVVLTRQAGRVEFERPTDLQSAVGVLHFMPGQTLYLLTPLGEGNFKAWFDGRLIDWIDGMQFYNAVCETIPERCTGKIVAPAQQEWWIQVRDAAGRTGWTNEPEKFGNKDRFG
jgi:hypothetical protein